MSDQVQFPKKIGLPAICIVDENDDRVIRDIAAGKYSHVYGSHECLLSTCIWRGLFNCEIMGENLVAVVVDEAHCISQLHVT